MLISSGGGGVLPPIVPNYLLSLTVFSIFKEGDIVSVLGREEGYTPEGVPEGEARGNF